MIFWKLIGPVLCWCGWRTQGMGHWRKMPGNMCRLTASHQLGRQPRVQTASLCARLHSYSAPRARCARKLLTADLRSTWTQTVASAGSRTVSNKGHCHTIRQATVPRDGLPVACISTWLLSGASSASAEQSHDTGLIQPVAGRADQG